MKVSFVQRSRIGEVFAPSAFDNQVGKTIPFRREDGSSTTARVLKAAVSDDGRSVEIVVDVDDITGLTSDSVSLSDVSENGGQS